MRSPTTPGGITYRMFMIATVVFMLWPAFVTVMLFEDSPPDEPKRAKRRREVWSWMPKWIKQPWW